ncbi:hypothetical protein [Streptomyces olivaceus]|uniref:hypothetical protein n=1 Tax=Streptomyces olivaceus TaxID=47716 RepID=UPI00405788F2
MRERDRQWREAYQQIDVSFADVQKVHTQYVTSLEETVKAARAYERSMRGHEAAQKEYVDVVKNNILAEQARQREMEKAIRLPSTHEFIKPSEIHATREGPLPAVAMNRAPAGMGPTRRNTAVDNKLRTLNPLRHLAVVSYKAPVLTTATAGWAYRVWNETDLT